MMLVHRNNINADIFLYAEKSRALEKANTFFCCSNSAILFDVPCQASHKSIGMVQHGTTRYGTIQHGISLRIKQSIFFFR